MDYPLDEFEMLAKDIEYSLANNNSDRLSDGDPDRIRQLLKAYQAAVKQRDELHGYLSDTSKNLLAARAECDRLVKLNASIVEQRDNLLAALERIAHGDGLGEFVAKAAIAKHRGQQL